MYWQTGSQASRHPGIQASRQPGIQTARKPVKIAFATCNLNKQLSNGEGFCLLQLNLHADTSRP